MLTTRILYCARTRIGLREVTLATVGGHTALTDTQLIVATDGIFLCGKLLFATDCLFTVHGLPEFRDLQHMYGTQLGLFTTLLLFRSLLR